MKFIINNINFMWIKLYPYENEKVWYPPRIIERIGVGEIKIFRNYSIKWAKMSFKIKEIKNK